jgi:DNA-binding NarL/FixJ family response regulator
VPPIRVLAVDDHPLLREGIATLVRADEKLALIAQAANGRDAIALHREHRPDVTLLDLRLPDMSGIDVLIAIRSEFADAKVLVLTTADGDVEIQRALRAGARGYMLKTMPPAELISAIHDVHAGRKRIPPEIAAHLAQHDTDEALTTRELDVLRAMAGGNRNRDIAGQLFITEETVKVHVKHILDKLSAKDRTDAVAIALRRGIIHL